MITEKSYASGGGMSVRSRGMFRRILLPALIAGCVLSTGCIRSRVVITSEPSGAEVIWRDEFRGQTPIEIPIKWYWYYDYTLEKEGYEPVVVLERIRTMPWFLMPLDLFAEMIPVPIPDTRRRHYVLEPAEPEDEWGPPADAPLEPIRLGAAEGSAAGGMSATGN